MSSPRLWDRASGLPATIDGRLRPEIANLPTGLPGVAELFTFARDAELRFATARFRIEERTWGAAGERLMVTEVAIQHPGHARVTTTDPALGTAGSYELWLSDGETVRTYAARHKLGTERPVRRRVVGLDSPDLPGMSTVYQPLTALPADTLPEAFVHPGGFCQNVLGTGRCRIVGEAEVGSRPAIVVRTEHPRTTEIAGDRPDHSLEVAFDREIGAILRLIERIGQGVTREAIVTSFIPDAPLPPGTFEFTLPSDAALIY